MAGAPRTHRDGALDALLGERIRRRRRDLQLPQSALGSQLGITFQQIQKYENGANRVSASMLLKLAAALGTSVTELLQDLDGAPARRGVRTRPNGSWPTSTGSRLPRCGRRS